MGKSIFRPYRLPTPSYAPNGWIASKSNTTNSNPLVSPCQTDSLFSHDNQIPRRLDHVEESPDFVQFNRSITFSMNAEKTTPKLPTRILQNSYLKPYRFGSSSKDTGTYKTVGAGREMARKTTRSCQRCTPYY